MRHFQLACPPVRKARPHACPLPPPLRPCAPSQTLPAAATRTLQGNAGWSHERKMVFAKRLIKRLAATS